MIARTAFLLLPAVVLLACQSPTHGQTTPSPEQQTQFAKAQSQKTHS